MDSGWTYNTLRCVHVRATVWHSYVHRAVRVVFVVTLVKLEVQDAVKTLHIAHYIVSLTWWHIVDLCQTVWSTEEEIYSEPGLQISQLG